MKQTLEAIYENGVFKPVKPPVMKEGQRIKITWESIDQDSTEEILELAAEVFSGLTEDDIEEIERIASDRSLCFDS